MADGIINAKTMEFLHKSLIDETFLDYQSPEVIDNYMNLINIYDKIDTRISSYEILITNQIKEELKTNEANQIYRGFNNKNLPLYSLLKKDFVDGMNFRINTISNILEKQKKKKNKTIHIRFGQ